MALTWTAACLDTPAWKAYAAASSSTLSSSHNRLSTMPSAEARPPRGYSAGLRGSAKLGTKPGGGGRIGHHGDAWVIAAAHRPPSYPQHVAEHA
jgi:hypothetical protein